MKKTTRILYAVGSSFILFMTMVTIYRVFMRLVFNATPSWSEELSSLTLVWVTMLCICIGVKEDSHLKMTLAYDLFPEKARRFLDFLNMTFMFLFAAYVMIRHGISMVAMTSTSRLSSLPVPNSMLFIMVPIAGALTVVSLIPMFHAFFKKDRSEV